MPFNKAGTLSYEDAYPMPDERFDREVAAKACLQSKTTIKRESQEIRKDLIGKRLGFLLAAGAVFGVGNAVVDYVNTSDERGANMSDSQIGGTQTEIDTMVQNLIKKSVTHSVHEGQTLESIFGIYGKGYDVSKEMIRLANNLKKGQDLVAGTILRIPIGKNARFGLPKGGIDSMQGVEIFKNLAESTEVLSKKDVSFLNFFEDNNAVAKSYKEILFSKEGLTVDALKKLNAFWVQVYQEAGHKKAMKNAFDRFEPDRDMIIQNFKKEGVPADFAYGVLPESGYENICSSYACGHFQQTYTTGKNYGLIGKGFDYRQVPEKASVAAGKFWSDHLKAFKDPLLALASYNSGMPWSYLKTLEEGETPTAEGYISFLNKRVKHLYEGIKTAGIYRTKAGESLYSIADKFGVSYEKIAEINVISKTKGLALHQVVYVPERGDSEMTKAKKKYFQYVVRRTGIQENFIYMARVPAYIAQYKSQEFQAYAADYTVQMASLDKQ